MTRVRGQRTHGRWSLKGEMVAPGSWPSSGWVPRVKPFSLPSGRAGEGGKGVWVSPRTEGGTKGRGGNYYRSDRAPGVVHKRQGDGARPPFFPWPYLVFAQRCEHHGSRRPGKRSERPTHGFACHTHAPSLSLSLSSGGGVGQKMNQKRDAMLPCVTDI